MHRNRIRVGYHHTPNMILYRDQVIGKGSSRPHHAYNMPEIYYYLIHALAYNPCTCMNIDLNFSCI